MRRPWLRFCWRPACLAFPARVGVEGGGAEGFEPGEQVAEPPVVVDPGLVVAVLVGAEPAADIFAAILLVDVCAVLTPTGTRPLRDVGQASGFQCAASHSRSVSSLVRASCSRAKSASVFVRTSV
jgi:hypothetical protein